RTADGIFADSFRGGLAWGTHLRAAQAHRLRLHLSSVRLPAETHLWVWGLGEEPRAFDLGLLRTGGDLWAPSVGGEDVFLEVEIPAGAANDKTGFEIHELGEILAGDPLRENAAGACIVDATCVDAGTFDAIAEARRAVAHLEFLSGGFIYESSGGKAPDLSTLPHSNGSTLLATGEASDFTFVRLNSIPAGRALLGWTATP